MVEPGSGLKAAIKKVINDDGVGVTFKGAFSAPLSESPKGTLDVSTQRVALGNTVDFTVRLTPSTKNYAVVGYNVAGIELWRKKESDLEFSMWKSIAVTASDQDVFQYRWEPGPEDLGKSEFAAFAATELPVIPILEVGDDSVRQVEVACFSTGAQSLSAGAARASVGTGSAEVSASSQTCADEWIGTSSHEVFGSLKIDAEVVWKLDPAASAGSTAAYRASGTVNFFYTAIEDLGCSVTPKVFSLGPEDSVLAVDYRTSPATFLVLGRMGREITIACPDSDPLDTLIFLPWVNGAGSVSNGGLTIEGGFSNELATSSFRFVRP